MRVECYDDRRYARMHSRDQGCIVLSSEQDMKYMHRKLGEVSDIIDRLIAILHMTPILRLINCKTENYRRACGCMTCCSVLGMSRWHELCCAQRRAHRNFEVQTGTRVQPQRRRWNDPALSASSQFWTHRPATVLSGHHCAQHKMRSIVTHVAWTAWSVCVSVSSLREPCKTSRCRSGCGLSWWPKKPRIK